MIGRSGAGKSVLLHRLIRQDIAGGYAVVVFDPGDLVRDVLEALPEDRLARVRHFTVHHPLPYNPLARRPEDQPRLASELFALIDQVTAERSANGQGQPLTARMRRLLRYALAEVMKEPGADLSRLATYLLEQRTTLRHTLELREDEFAATWEGLIDRLDFLADPRIRRIICNGHVLDFGRVIDEGNVLLISLAGLEPAFRRFVGTLLFHGLQATIFERKPEDRRPVAVYVDEFHDFVTSPQAIATFQTLFNQGRRHLLSLTVAHTDFGTVPRPLLQTIHDNAAAIVAFSCGDEPAEKMSRIFGGEWPPQAIQFLPDYQAIVRVGGHLGDVVKPIETYPAPQRLRTMIEERPDLAANDPADPFALYEEHRASRDLSRNPRRPRRAPQASPAT